MIMRRMVAAEPGEALDRNYFLCPAPLRKTAGQYKNNH